MLELDQVEAARRRIEAFVRRTPLIPWTPGGFTERGGGAPVWLKAENLQVTGAFKARGAMNRLVALREEHTRHTGEPVRGVVTASSGNHGQALAWAGRELGIDVVVVAPEDASSAKTRGIEAYGARLERCGTTSRARIERAQAIASVEGRVFVSSYDDLFVMAGQGTVGLEIVEDLPGVTEVVVPVGGGGLMAGVATAVRGLRPDVVLTAVEPEGAAGALASSRAGRRLELDATDSIADGLRTLGPGALPWEVLAKRVDRFVTVSDEAIRTAMHALAFEAKLVVEPSGAATVAALLSRAIPLRAGQVAVLSGGNVAPATFLAFVGAGA